MPSARSRARPEARDAASRALPGGGERAGVAQGCLRALALEELDGLGGAPGRRLALPEVRMQPRQVQEGRAAVAG